MWIMIAGPYSSGAVDERDREENLRVLNNAAFDLWRCGHVPIIGVNLTLPIIRAAGEEHFDRLMMPISLALTERCDAVLRIGGPSRGADDEVESFRARSLPVYRSLEEIPPSIASNRGQG